MWTDTNGIPPHPPVSCLTLMTSAFLQPCVLVCCWQCQAGICNETKIQVNLGLAHCAVLWLHFPCSASWGIYVIIFLALWELTASAADWLTNQLVTDSGRNMSHLWADSRGLDRFTCWKCLTSITALNLILHLLFSNKEVERSTLGGNAPNITPFGP